MVQAASRFCAPLMFVGVTVVAAVGIITFLILVLIERRFTAWAMRRQGGPLAGGGRADGTRARIVIAASNSKMTAPVSSRPELWLVTTASPDGDVVVAVAANVHVIRSPISTGRRQ